MVAIQYVCTGEALEALEERGDRQLVLSPPASILPLLPRLASTNKFLNRTVLVLVGAASDEVAINTLLKFNVTKSTFALILDTF